VVCNDSKTGRKQEGRQGLAATELLTKNIKIGAKTSFSDVMSEVQKYLQDVSAGKGQYLKIPMYKNVV
jgi:hypothetical protein